MEKKTILVIDDDPTTLKSLEHMLSDKYVILTAGGGKAAIEMLESISNNVDLIISDLNMPDINGAYFYLHLANKFPGLENKIIFMTAGPFANFLEDFGLSKKNPCMTKPIDRETLQQTLEKFFSEAAKSSGGKD